MMKSFLFLIFNNLLIHSMPHRTWISLIDWFIDRLISWLISRLIDWLIDCPVDCLPGWVNEVSEANGRDDEIDDLSDRSTDRSWLFDEEDVNDDCSTEDPSDDSYRCFKFSVMRDNCLPVDWFSDEDDERVDCLNDFSFGCSSDCSSDFPSDWSSDCSSSWLCENERDDMSDEMSDRLYNEMRDNRLYNCLLNTDENSDDWKNFENRNETWLSFWWEWWENWAKWNRWWEFAIKIRLQKNFDDDEDEILIKQIFQHLFFDSFEKIFLSKDVVQNFFNNDFFISWYSYLSSSQNVS